MLRNLVLCVALITGLSLSGVSALCDLSRLCGWLAFQSAWLEALVLLSGRTQPSAPVFGSCMRNGAASRFTSRSEFTVVCHLCGGLFVLRVVMAWQTGAHGSQAGCAPSTA